MIHFNLKTKAGIISFALACALIFCACSNPRFKIEQVQLPEQDFQASVNFPNWLGYVDDMLAVNSTFSFKAFKNKGTVYLTVDPNVQSFELSINNNAIKTDRLLAGNTYQIDFSKVAVSGKNTIQITNIIPYELEKAVTVNIPYPVVTENLKSNLINKEVFRTIEDIVESDVANGFTSAQVAVIKDGFLVYKNAWGSLNSYNPDGTPVADPVPVTNDTLYDIASNTKIYSTVFAVQYLVDKGLLDVNTKLVDIFGNDFIDDTVKIRYARFEGKYPGLKTIKEWKSAITVKQLLNHQSGFPPRGFYFSDKLMPISDSQDDSSDNKLYVPDFNRQKTFEQGILKTPLCFEPGTDTQYSDINYMILGFIVEKITEKNQDQFLKETYLNPMGLKHITYNPLKNGFTKNDCAATELNGNTRDNLFYFPNIRTQTIQGEVHDEDAFYSMEGISGHAGLFANATDLAKLAFVMETGGYGTTRFFSETTRDYFIAPQNLEATKYGIGWNRAAENKRVYFFGPQSPNSSIGHLGWTGTWIMVDLENDLVIAILTNKKNTPLTYNKDIEKSNVFNGDYYTTGTLGIISQLVYMGIEPDTKDLNKNLDNLLIDMIHQKNKLVETTENIYPDHPIYKSARAITQAALKRADRTHNRSLKKRIPQN